MILRLISGTLYTNMLTKNITKQPKAIVEVTITVPWVDLQVKYSETLQKFAAEVEMPGFRKGQAPLDMVEPKVASQVQQELLKTSMPQALIEALQDTNIIPIDYPKYQVISFGKGQDLSFKATITERPTVKVGNYKTIKPKRPPLKTIDDQQVDKVLNDLFKRWKARQMNNTQSEPNDDFAKGVGSKDLADLRQKIKQDLEAEAKYNNELDYEEMILQEVEKITEVDIPDILIQDELNRMLVSLQRRVADMGLLMDDYLKGQNKSVEGLKNEWRPQAERNVRMELGLSEIAKMENVNIADDELQAEIDKIQDNRVKTQFENQEPRMHLRHALRQTKTLNLLKTLVG